MCRSLSHASTLPPTEPLLSQAHLSRSCLRCFCSHHDRIRLVCAARYYYLSGTPVTGHYLDHSHSAFFGTSIALKSFRDEFHWTGRSSAALADLSANIVTICGFSMSYYTTALLISVSYLTAVDRPTWCLRWGYRCLPSRILYWPQDRSHGIGDCYDCRRWNHAGRQWHSW